MRIAVAAEAFGFGPASKALAIAVELRRRGHDPVPFASSVAKEFFVRHGWPRTLDVAPAQLASSSLSKDFDAAVVLLDRRWARFFAPIVPTVLADSLAFMWPQSVFEDSLFTKISAYAVQDVFGGYARARSLCDPASNVVPVGAIVGAISSTPSGPAGKGSPLASLGGFSIPSSTDPDDSYWKMIREILPCPPWQYTASLSSRLSGPGVLSLTHNEFMSAAAESGRLAVSPGLTTLLELAHRDIPVLPLPPQNYSQALIVSNVAEGAVGALWGELAEYFKVPVGLEEHAGVDHVRRNIVRMNSDSAFLALVQDSLRSAAPTSLLSQIGGRGFSGVQESADLIERVAV